MKQTNKQSKYQIATWPMWTIKTGPMMERLGATLDWVITGDVM